MGEKSFSQHIYLDNQASTPLDLRVFEAMRPWFVEQFGNPHSGDHWFGWQASAAIERARGDVAALIGAEPAEIIFTSGATEANNFSIVGAARALKGRKDRILVSAVEHKCVLEAARALAAEGFEVVHVPVHSDGLIDLAALRNAIDDRTALVSVMAVNNEIGTIQPLEAIGAICRKAGALFHTDAAQALAAMRVDVEAAQVDLMSLSAHKAYGPKGVGALYVRRDMPVRLAPIIHGGGQEAGLRSGTLPTPLCVGFGAACSVLATEFEADVAHMTSLAQRLLEGLKARIPGISLNGRAQPRHPGNLNLCFPDVDAHALLGALQPHVAASTGSACTSGTPEPSHVLRAIGLRAEDAESSVRFSVGRFTTADEIDDAVALIIGAAWAPPSSRGSPL